MSAIAPARREAYAILRAVGSGRADLPSAVARARDRLTDPRDRALAAEIATGTLRWRGALDAVIAAFARGGIARLDPEVLEILRLAAYQLLHLQRVPPSAVVHDAVELVRASGKRSASGLVNAVLRRVDRERHALPLPARPADPHADRASALDYLAVTLSHPRWLVERWLARFGFDSTEAWLLFNNQPAPLTLRANTLLTTRDELARELADAGIETEPTRFAPEGLRVTRGNPLERLEAEGRFMIQDEASQLVGAFVGALPGHRLLDACAAPGGKTLLMAAAVGPSGLVVAADLRARRVALLARTLGRSGARSVRVVRADAARPLPFGAVFDVVLLDAPCSGLGTIRRDPEIRWRRQPEDLAALAEAQRTMLEHAAGVVRPGGRLVYATCSSEPDENEEVVASFLAARPGFEGAGDAATGLGQGRAASVLDAAGHLRTWPFRHGLEAFFAAMLRRRAA